MLTVEIHPDEAFVWYLAPDACPNNGGYVGRVFPGGEFHDLTYDQLVVLGTGKHEVLIDERRYGDNKGEAPANPKDHLMFVFYYETGAMTESELKILLGQEATKRSVEEMVADLPAWVVDVMKKKAEPEPERWLVWRSNSSQEELDREADILFEGIKKWHEWTKGT
jgi:hypothetical protein